MTAQKRLLYGSSNGDCWYLCYEGGAVFVEHVPNAASGGEAKRLQLSEFLRVEPHSAQHQALVALIGTLVPSTGASHRN